MAASTYLNQIQQLYIAYFGRPADPVGLTFWATQVDAANGSVAAVIAGFASSQESSALYSGVTVAQKVSAIYQNLFNRGPEPAGLAFWVQQIDSGALTQAQAAYQIMSSAGPYDALAAANKLTLANSFTAQIDTAAEISGYNGAVAAAYGRAYLASVDSTPASVSSATSNLLSAVATATGTSLSTPVTPTPSSPAGATYALTTGIDTFTGTAGDDLFTALINTTTPANSTLTAGDTINGGAGTDTLSLTVQGAMFTTWPAAKVSNIETLLISDQHTGGISVYTLAGVTGLTTVASNVSKASVAFYVLQAGTTVAMIGDGMTALGDMSMSWLGNGAINLLITGGTKGTPTIVNSGSATTATINSTGAANTVGEITLNSSGSSFTSLTINATTDLKATLRSADYSSTSTLIVTGAGKVDLGTGASQRFTGSTIDASANSGGLSMALDTGITHFVGSSGDDRLYGTNSVLTSPVSIDGGAGIDTVSTRLINYNNATAFKSFEVLDLTGGTSNGGALDVSQMTGSTITGVLLDGDTGSNVTLRGLSLSPSGFNVNVTGNSGDRVTTLNFNDVSATNDVLNYTFNPTLTTAAYAGTVRSDGIETININSSGIVGTFNRLTITDDALKSLVITGNRPLDVAVTAQNGVAGVSQLTSIDGSADTGNLTIRLSTPTAAVQQSALSIKTGSGNDNITVTTSAVAGSVGSTVTTGTGTDTIVVSAATAQSTSAVQFTTITDFAQGDRISFGTNITSVDQAVFGVPPIDLSTAVTLALQGQATTVARWFSYNSNTYVVNNTDDDAGFSDADIVVKLSGTVNLSTATALFGSLSLSAGA